MGGTRKRALAALGVAVVAVAIRLPTIASSRHLVYDEGVYGASVDLMRAGFVPFRDFFSSQGPVYLPLLWAFDLTGIGGFRAPRLAVLVAAVAIATGVLVMVRRDGGTARAWAVATVVATSGIMLVAVTPLHSVGIATAFGLWSLIVATGRTNGPASSIAAGVLAALAVATKSMFALPVALAALAVVVTRRGLAGLGLFLAAGSATGLAVTVPFGLADVWDQYVVFHTEKPWSHSVSENIAGLGELLLERDLPLIVILIAGIAFAVVRRRGIAPSSLPTGVLAGWLVAAAVVVVVPQQLMGGFERFAVVLVVPAALAAARLPIPTPALIVVAALSLPFQWFTQDAGTTIRPDDLTQQAIEVVAGVGNDAFTVSDEPGIVWVGGGLSHPDTVDSSFARIATHRVTTQLVAAARSDPASCAYASWSTRFASLGLDGSPDGYVAVVEAEWRSVSVRSSCR